jgi:hypothetical protein
MLHDFLLRRGVRDAVSIYVVSPLPRATSGRQTSQVTLATGLILLRSKMLPAWIGWLSIVIGVVGVAGPLGFFAFLASGIWILIRCYFLYRDESRARNLNLIPSLLVGMQLREVGMCPRRGRQSGHRPSTPLRYPPSAHPTIMEEAVLNCETCSNA